MGVGLNFLARLIVYGATLAIALLALYMLGRLALWLWRRYSARLAQKAHEQKVRLLIAWSKTFKR